VSNSTGISAADWTREDHEDVAGDKLLDAAGQAFAELGVARATMVDVARHAGCSRATLYRYFDGRASLHLAYVNRAALSIAARISDDRPNINTPSAVLAERILAGIDAVRSDPLLAVWFEPENMAVPIALSRDSEVLAALAAQFTAGLDLPAWTDDELDRRAGWLLRSIVSLLAMPVDSPADERAIVESFVVPPLLNEHQPGSPS
jgi:AcrR family transcriptional regulator